MEDEGMNVILKLNALDAYALYYWLRVTTFNIERFSNDNGITINLLKGAVEKFKDEFSKNIDPPLMDLLDTTIEGYIFSMEARDIILYDDANDNID